ncbi:tyrosine--tRNA ligase, partial [Ruminococcaceae bacterium OttesenSCG-928-L11]|nr:tyrosine--tRNA ligase [Ruminococcaceae bacterium OttesenSCG-928-L11]
MTLFEELNRRGLIAQMTHPEQVEKLLNSGKGVFYMGFDATANSLHVGHFLVLTVIKRMQMAGLTPILLLGTGTTMVGDPSGRTDMRQMLSVEEINYNAEQFVKQMGRIVDLDKAIIERNGDWLMKLNYIEMLREVGAHFSVNKMLTAECFKSRMEQGLSFLEFNYMIMQSYDFLQLFRKHKCTMQLGGNDQWSNIIGGVELVRRVDGGEAFGMTFTLLTTKDGKKMGKTQAGAVWLDPERTPPYEFFQYWRNVDDADVINCMKMLTFLPIEEIEDMEKWEGSQLNKAKEILAYELTKDVHGKEAADKALEAAKAVFGGSGVDENMPSTTLADADFTDGAINIMDLLVKTGLCPSKGEARRLVQQKGISVDLGEGFAAVEDIAFAIPQNAFDGNVIVKKGKKVFHKV